MKSGFGKSERVTIHNKPGIILKDEPGFFVIALMLRPASFVEQGSVMFQRSQNQHNDEGYNQRNI